MFAKIPLLISAAFLSASAAAHAGGFIAPVAEPVPLSAAPAPSWESGYVGATLGHAFNGEDRLGVRYPGEPLENAGTFKLRGPNIGLRAGYMANFGTFIGGAELGATFGNISSEIKETITDVDVDVRSSVKSKVKHTVTLRGKLGSEVAKDTLVYGIGGLSYGAFNYSAKANGTDEGEIIDVNTSRNYNRVGYVLGIGIERRLNDRVSITGEYEYASYGKEKLRLGDMETRATPKFHNVAVGLNYRF